MPSFMSSDVAKIRSAPWSIMSATTESTVVSGRSAVLTLSSTIRFSAGRPSCSITYSPASKWACDQPVSFCGPTRIIPIWKSSLASASPVVVAAARGRDHGQRHDDRIHP